MGLVLGVKSALYNGVNQQSAEHRLETQVEECINAYPTISRGLLKRNPTAKLNLTSAISYTKDMWTYGYDRGLAGDSEEKYSIMITIDGMQIVNIITGEVYTKTNGGLIYEGDAEQYLKPFVNSRGYSAITVKDTTFLLNKNVQPKIDGLTYSGDGATSVVSNEVKTILMKKSPPKSGSYLTSKFNGTTVVVNQKDYFPSSASYVQNWGNQTARTIFHGSTTTVIVDGVTITLTYPSDIPPISYSEYLTDLTNKIIEVIDENLYVVYQSDANTDIGINIKKIDQTALSVSFSLTIPVATGNILYNSDEVDYYSGITASVSSDSAKDGNDLYEKKAFIWIKGSNPTSAYSYTFSVTTDGGVTVGSTVSATTTEAVATAIVDYINAAGQPITASQSGSIVQVLTTDGAKFTDATINDTFGNQASYAWTLYVQALQDLPATMPFDSLVKVQDVENAGNSDGYWLRYKDSRWEEASGLSVKGRLLPYTMPHILVRNPDNTFTLKQKVDWAELLVGDNDSNSQPSFTKDGNTIKDIFFMKNRLGFITKQNIIMSEVGNYGNFWRTSVVALLDSDRIDTTVDANTVVELEYVTYLQDALMLFSDKAQFRVAGDNVLSPKSIQITKTSSYEMNKNIRPVFVNDMIFFCAIRGDYTAVMQYSVDVNSNISTAVDVSAQIEQYIPANVTSLSFSPINNMLVLHSLDTPNTLYVYKYYDSAGKRQQSAWFKWVYNGDIYSQFSLGRNLNILINRLQNSAVESRFLGDGICRDYPVTRVGILYASPNSLTSIDNFEVQDLTPIKHNSYFVDASDMVDTTEVGSLNGLVGAGSITYNEEIILVNGDIYINPIFGNVSSTYTLTATIKDIGGASRTVTDNDVGLIISRSANEYLASVSVSFDTPDGLWFSGFAITDVGSNILAYNGLFENGSSGWTYDVNWVEIFKQVDEGSIIRTRVDIGEWIYESRGIKKNTGNLKLKSAIISAEEGSDFNLEVKYLSRKQTRVIPAKYAVDKRPIIYGDSKDTRLAIISTSTSGFRVNSVTLEGNYNARDRRR